jgi:hypothetical protein
MFHQLSKTKLGLSAITSHPPCAYTTGTTSPSKVHHNTHFFEIFLFGI